MAFMASAPLRRVVSDTDEMDVVSSSSTENSVPPTQASTNNTNTNTSQTSPIIRSLRFFSGSGQNVVMEEDHQYSNNSAVQCHPFPEERYTTPDAFIGGHNTLDRSPHITRNSNILSDTDATLFSTSRVGTTITSSSHPHQQHEDDENNDSDDDDDDDDDLDFIGLDDTDTASITSAHSYNSNSNNNNHHHHQDDYNPLLENETHASQKSMISQRSNASARSVQSNRSTQSWGQLTEIDLPPKVNGMYGGMDDCFYKKKNV